ncbi:MAG: uncharacterized protein KVP18_002565 [Porospora cf. gigantea A]|nr:MAG: hypothetical protein KVP18_002565 [Porospora cf. gigantea A]
MFVIDADRIDMANRDALGFVIDAVPRSWNNILATCFFELSEVLPMEEAIAMFNSAIQKTYGKKGQHVVDANNEAVDAALANLHQVHYDLNLWKNAKDSEADAGCCELAWGATCIITNRRCPKE